MWRVTVHNPTNDIWTFSIERDAYAFMWRQTWPCSISKLD